MSIDKSQQLNELLESAHQAGKLIKEYAEEGKAIRIVSHLDADGLASAGILGKALSKMDSNFSIRIVKRIDESILKELSSLKASMLIFTDLGSGYLDLIKTYLSNFQVVVLDHHMPVGTPPPKFSHVNPHLHGFDGGEEISGSGVVYLTVKSIDASNVDSACVAIIGALGDLQDKNKERELTSINKYIVNDAIKANFLEVKKDLIFYGRETRPIHKALASTTAPFLPGLSGEEDACLSFLSTLGIRLKDGDTWRTLSDLESEEKTSLFSELTKLFVSKGFPGDAALSLIGTVYILTRENRWSPLRDAREYASLINVCGRMGKAGLGVAICMGDRGAALEEAEAVYSTYRKTLAKYIDWVTCEPKAREELDSIYVIHGENEIDEKILSAVTTILSSNGFFAEEKPIIAVASSNEEFKISARASNSLVERGLNLGEIMREASIKFSGMGGGHRVAAGAQVPKGNLSDFIKYVNQLVRGSLGK